LNLPPWVLLRTEDGSSSKVGLVFSAQTLPCFLLIMHVLQNKFTPWQSSAHSTVLIIASFGCISL
jgi:hypothetical protein